MRFIIAHYKENNKPVRININLIIGYDKEKEATDMVMVYTGTQSHCYHILVKETCEEIDKLIQLAGGVIVENKPEPLYTPPPTNSLGGIDGGFWL